MKIFIIIQKVSKTIVKEIKPNTNVKQQKNLICQDELDYLHKMSIKLLKKSP